MPMTEFDSAAFIRFLGTFADRIHEQRDELTRLDSAIGDADHGINMDRGFTAVRAKLAELDGSDLGAIAKAVGMTLISTVGGASGPLYGTFFLRLGTAFGEAQATDAAGLGTALRAGLEAAASAAAEGRDRITPLVARKGRASYLGERAADHQDPGATSTTILFESLRDAVAGADRDI